jgi:hypothetical protein
MADTDIVRPVGTTDQDPGLSARPMVFHPRGFLAAILPGPTSLNGLHRPAET